jgi:D-3-phosphoglycerate dehydrogenase
MAASKNLLNSDCRTRAGDFGVRNKYKAFEVLGKTLGLVGYGNIGRELAKLAAAVGMKISVFDPFIDAASVAPLGYAYEHELDQLLAKADVVSLHVPLTEKTRAMIGARELKLMKSSSVLINCARGEIVDEGALAEALKAGHIHSAAADVLTKEPFDPDNPLLKLENFIITPHMAGLTREAAHNVSTMAAEGVLAILAGKKWPHVANQEVYEHPIWRR